MKKEVPLKKDPDSGELFIDLEEFKDMYDIKEVAYYEFERLGEALTLKFFDKDKNFLYPQAN